MRIFILVVLIGQSSKLTQYTNIDTVVIHNNLNVFRTNINEILIQIIINSDRYIAGFAFALYFDHVRFSA